MKFTFATIFLSALIFNPRMNTEGRMIQKEVSNYLFYFVSFDLNMIEGSDHSSHELFSSYFIYRIRDHAEGGAGWL